MSRVIVKMINHKPEIVEFCDGKEWQETGRIVLKHDYGCFDRVHLSSVPYELTMWVDDEGALYDDKVLNFYIRCNNPFYPVQPIFGNVVITRGHLKEDDIEYQDVTEADLELVNSIIIGGEKNGFYRLFL